MAVLWISPEFAARYAPYIEELRDFFAQQHLHCGAPEHLVTLAARLEESGSFREDMTSMVRVILLREGGTVPRADLLQIVSVAIGGDHIDESPIDIQQPVQHIFSFINGVLGRPWNQPPGEERLAAEPMPIPISHAESDFAEAEEESRSLLEEKRAAPTPDFVRPESVYSRFTNLVAGMHALTTQVPAAARPAPESSLEREPDRPPDSAPTGAQEAVPQQLPTAPLPHPNKVVPWPKLEPEIQLLPPILPLHNPAPERSKVSPAVLLPPIPAADEPAREKVDNINAALAAELHPHLIVLPAPTLEPKPPSPSASPAIHLPNLDPNLIPNPNSKPAAPRIPPSQVRVALISASASALFVAALMVAARHSSSEAVPRAANLPLANPVPRPAPAPEPAPTNLATAEPPATNAAPAPIPDSASVAQPRHVVRDDSDEDIARPWSNIPPKVPPSSPPNIAEQPAARVATPTGPNLSADSSPSPSTITARATRPGPPAPETLAAEHVRPAPDVSQAPSSAHFRTVSSAEMAGNLLYAPRPSYPALAKIAHIQGQVVVQAVVGPDGTVSSAHALSGHRLLRNAAVDATLRRHYRPYLVDGRPVEVLTTVTFDFGPSPAPVRAPATDNRTSAYADLPPR